jgi:hypothetical protein
MENRSLLGSLEIIKFKPTKYENLTIVSLYHLRRHEVYTHYHAKHLYTQNRIQCAIKAYFNHLNLSSEMLYELKKMHIWLTSSRIDSERKVSLCILVSTMYFNRVC